MNSGEKIVNLTREYVSQMDNTTVEKLYNLYKIDFQMFDYNLKI